MPVAMMPLRTLVLLGLLGSPLRIPLAAQSVDGEWDASYETPGGIRQFKLTLVSKGDSLTGTVRRAAGGACSRR